jgi:NAD(P)-dependent dehydrogenase (short-subunit alcohol dehydrogenase family)
MSRALITGGTGVLGSQLRPRLIAAGNAVRIMSRRAPRPGEAQGVEWAQADLASGEGLDSAVQADTITMLPVRASATYARRCGTGRLPGSHGWCQPLRLHFDRRHRQIDFKYYRPKLRQRSSSRSQVSRIRFCVRRSSTI